MHPAMKVQTSNSPAPDYSAKKDVVGLLKGTKKPPQEVNYAMASTGSPNRCHECADYLKPGARESSCAIVVGIVQSNGTCDLWRQRDYSEESPVGKKALTISIVMES